MAGGFNPRNGSEVKENLLNIIDDGNIAKLKYFVLYLSCTKTFQSYGASCLFCLAHVRKAHGYELEAPGLSLASPMPHR